MDPGTDTLMLSILFLHLVLTHVLRCGEPISGIIFKSTQSFWGFQGVSAVGRFNSELSHLSKIPFESLSPLPGNPRDQFWQ